jgi:hypothetical protein
VRVMAATLAEVLARLDRVCPQRRRGKGRWWARCPCHQDPCNDLSVWESRSGSVRVRCARGCRAYDVLRAIGLEPAKGG